jgi:hypothetical protein
MPIFKVTIRKPIGMFHGDTPIRNPFEIADAFQAGLASRFHERVWEMEAKDEKAIRAHFKKAQAEGIPQVIGFEIASIEPFIRTQA